MFATVNLSELEATLVDSDEFTETDGTEDETAVGTLRLKLLEGKGKIQVVTDVEFDEAVGNEDDAAVKISNVELLEGTGTLEEGAISLVGSGFVVFAKEVASVNVPELDDVPIGAVEFAETGGTARDERAGSEEAVTFPDDVGMTKEGAVVMPEPKGPVVLAFVEAISVETVLGSMVELTEASGEDKDPTDVDIPVPGSVILAVVEEKKSGVRGLSVFVKFGPVEVVEAFRLGLGLILATVPAVLVTDVVPLKFEVWGTSELGNELVSVDEFETGVGEALGGAVLATDEDSLKLDVGGRPEFENGKPVEFKESNKLEVGV